LGCIDDVVPSGIVQDGFVIEIMSCRVFVRKEKASELKENFGLRE
jgi:hypothetical protein